MAPMGGQKLNEINRLTVGKKAPMSCLWPAYKNAYVKKNPSEEGLMPYDVAERIGTTLPNDTP